MSCLNPYICRKEPFDFLTAHNCRIGTDGHIEFYSYKNKNSVGIDINEDVEKSSKRGYSKIRFRQLSLMYDNKTVQKILNHPNIVLIPCGTCEACVASKKRDWTLRNNLEYNDVGVGYFITLTCEECYLLKNKLGLYSIPKELANYFIKELRKELKKDGQKLRYFYCGEYGDITFRPHFHFIIYNEIKDLKQKVLLKNRWHYESEMIKWCWTYGIYDIEDLNEYAISYTSGYVQKKLSDNRLYDELQIQKPYISMSRKPGIGYNYFVKNFDKIYKYDGVYQKDFVDGRAKKFPVPKFFDRKLRELDENKYNEVKKGRVFTFQIPNTDKKIIKFYDNKKIINRRTDSL